MRYHPEVELPDLSTNSINLRLEELLAGRLAGRRSLHQLLSIDVYELLSQTLSWSQMRVLDSLAPGTLILPSGREKKLNYTNSECPVLSATIQELFGWKTNPRLGEGRIALKFEILSPARRPVQITQDLGRFWKESYPQIRKELRGRYPRHKWPEEPP
jgi:ATP-dependent helicase HrpB